MGRTRGKPHNTRLSRFIRGRRLDRNPLRRGSDRAETAILAALVAAFLAGAPFAAQATGAWARAALQREQAEQESSWHLVPAVLLTAASTGVRVSNVAPGPQAKARWIAPNGTTIISSIPVTSGGHPGTTVRIWVARDGGLAQQPLMDSQVSSEVGCAEAGTVAALAVTLAVVGFLGRRSLDKRRLAAWDTEWRSAGPSSTRA